MKQRVIHKLLNTISASAGWLDQMVGNTLESGEIVEHIDDIEPPAGNRYILVAVVAVRVVA